MFNKGSPPPKAKKEPKPKASKPATPAKDSTAYAKHKERTAKRQREQSHAANDILPFPDVVNPQRTESCKRDFEKFCREFFPLWFPLPFSRDHLRAIGFMQEAVIDGSIRAWAMSRGSGKTALCKALAIFAVLYRWRRFVPLIGPDLGHSCRMLRDVKFALASNPLLLEGFPLACYPLLRLEGKAAKAPSQHAGGIPTRSTWTEGKLILPTVEGSQASGAILTTAGITGQIRGMSEATSDGSLLRPDFVIIDDFQTHESAYSASQCVTRLSIINADILQLAGPGVEIAAIIPCTVIRRGDAADELLNRKLHPEFRGERMKGMLSLPKNVEWWAKYAEVLRASLEEDENSERANELYRRERAIADDGAEAAWPERFKPREVSAIQSLMNIKILKPEVFAAEVQNEPDDFSLDKLSDLTPEMIVSKLNAYQRHHVPPTATKLTAFIDVQKVVLYWVVCAWDDDFTGYVIDYGTWPDMNRAYFTLGQVDQGTLARATGKEDLEGQLYAAMDTLTRQLLGHEWPREDGKSGARIDLCLIDGNWPESTNVVYQICRQSPYGANLLPSRGKYYGPNKVPISQRAKKSDETKGLEWYKPNTTDRGKAHLAWDTGFWKSHVLSRWISPMGSRGCLSVFGEDKRAHRMFADQMCSEKRHKLEGEERTVYQWIRTPNEDNHWFDGVVGCAVAASVCGISLDKVHQSTKPPTPEEPVSMAELQRQARARRGA